VSKAFAERRLAIAIPVVAILEVYGICIDRLKKKRGEAVAAKIIVQSFPAESTVEP